MEANERSIATAARLLREGGLVAFPTETVYGLGANALNAAAVERIFAAKGRPRTSPLIVHVADVTAARALAAEWPPAAETLARHFWPGPLTIIVRAAPAVPPVVRAGLTTVGLRVPAHPVAQQLLQAAGVPIAAPSANRFTQLSPSRAEHVRASLPDVFVLDGGAAQVGIESTVVSLAGEQPRLLRPGVIHQQELEALIGPLQLGPAEQPHESPGQHEQHYQPRTPLYLGHAPAEGRGYWLRWGSSIAAQPAAAAVELYALLHRLDAEGYDWIACEPVPDGVEWDGIRDRLQRAAI
jgi:L-threonylcarbamoyladenylate synthase